MGLSQSSERGKALGVGEVAVEGLVEDQREMEVSQVLRERLTGMDESFGKAAAELWRQLTGARLRRQS